MSKLQINRRRVKYYKYLTRLSSIVLFIFAYAIVITGSTYAFMSISDMNNEVANGDGGCFEVSYTGENLNAGTISTTTDYTQSAHTTVTLSKASTCKIYTEANIYLHTNTETTAPIETVHALKYKLYNGTTQISAGTITSKNDYLLATVPITDTATTYTIYLWIDANQSMGMYNNTSYSGYIYATSSQTSTIEGNYLVSFDEGNLFPNINKTENSLEISYDANTHILTLNGTSTSGSNLLNLYIYDNMVFNEGEIYTMDKKYISGSATGNGVSTISGEIYTASNGHPSTRNYVDVIFGDKNNRTKNMTVNSAAASEGRKLYLHIWFQNGINSYTFENFKIKVTFSKLLTTKTVTVNQPYGWLPTPIRDGYTFKGWNGKNLFNKDSVPETTGKYIKGDGTTANHAAYSIYKVGLKPNTTYTIRNSGKSNAPGYAIFNSSGTRISGENYNTRANITFTTPSTAAYIKLSVVTDSTGTDAYRYDKDYFQLEEGENVTSYEPYILSSTTPVTQAKNHTLTAIWEQN